MGSGLVTKTRNGFKHLVKQHPCFSEEGHYKFGRIHLPVSPVCNIQCKFCKRSFNKHEKRPGVAGGVLTPEKAMEVVEQALALCADITVVGIAGPGDTLATDHAIETFELVHERFPHLINCLSTNGLLLKEKASRILSVGVKTVTVTVNAIDPRILKEICSYIIYNGQHMTGEAATKWMIPAQLAGIHEVARLGAVVKINTVLIPGVNEDHVEEVARVTAGVGASMINIIPLIPQHEMKDIQEPDCRLLNRVREKAEKYLPVFRHCRQCRADACGIPGSGKDLAGQLYGERIETFSHG